MKILIIVLVLVLFLSLALYFSSGRGESLIAGFNSLPKEEREKYDTVALCKFMGKMMFIYSFTLLLWLIALLIEKDILFHIGTVIFILTTIFLLVYMNIGHRFKNE